nr:MAG TPA: hypothetical protein [Caudoviricetes sp.]
MCYFSRKKHPLNAQNGTKSKSTTLLHNSNVYVTMIPQG